jgi:hypothetical protein
MALTIANVQSGITSLVTAGSTSAAPAANTVIVDAGTLPAGDQTPTTYMVSVITGQTGTVDANPTNILINVGGTGNPVTGGATYGPLTSFSAANGGTPQTFRVSIPAGGARLVICVGNTAGGAGAIYNAGVSITRLFSTGGLYF